MDTQTKDYIISEFKKIRMEQLQSNSYNGDTEIIRDIAKRLDIQVKEVIKVLENKAVQNTKSKNIHSALNPFSKPFC